MPTLTVHVAEKQDTLCPQLTMPTIVAENVTPDNYESETKKDNIPDVPLTTMFAGNNGTVNKTEFMATVTESNVLPSSPVQRKSFSQNTVTQTSLTNIHWALILLAIIAVIVVTFMFYRKQSALTPGKAIEKETVEYQPETKQTSKIDPLEPGQQTVENSSGTEEAAITSVQESCGTFEMPEDKLVPNAVIILGRPDEAAKSLKASLVASCKYPVVFNEFESFFHYRKQLKKIINSKPRCVILIPAGKYADLNISLANFESLIREEAEMLRDNIVPFAFILSKEDTGNKKVTQFNAAIEELCNLRSFHLVSDGSDIKKLFFLIPNQNY